MGLISFIYGMLAISLWEDTNCFGKCARKLFGQLNTELALVCVHIWECFLQFPSRFPFS